MNFVETLESVMKQSGNSQREIAERLGFSNVYISKLIKGTEKPSPLMKCKIWELVDGDFEDIDFLLELLDEKTKEFVIEKINNSEGKIIKDLKVALKNDDYSAMIQLLAKHRNWSVNELGKDIGISNEELEKIIEGGELPGTIKKIVIRDRVNYDLANYSIIQKLPETIGNKLDKLNKWNMKRLAEANRKKIAKDGN